MNTNPNRHKAIEKIVKMNEIDRLKLLGMLLANFPEITNYIIDLDLS